MIGFGSRPVKAMLQILILCAPISIQRQHARDGHWNSGLSSCDVRYTALLYASQSNYDLLSPPPFLPLAGVYEWGDNNTLVGAALCCRVRINVLMADMPSGMFTVEVPESFGDD